MNGKTIVALLLLCSIAITTTVSGNVTDDRQFSEETTSIPFETWIVLLGAGLLFLVLACITGFGLMHASMTIIFGIISTLFLSGAAFATPVTGFYSYVANASTNASSSATPVVWGAFQPWMMWLVWGMATISFLLFILGVLILFRDFKDYKEYEEDMDWI